MNTTAPRIVLGIDLGTSGCKVCALDSSASLIASASAQVRTRSPRPGWTEQDPVEWLDALAAATRRLMSEAGFPPDQVCALALSTAAHIAVLLDARDRPVRRAILWNDLRSHEEARSLAQSHGDDIFRLTCHVPSTTWTLPHLLWVRKHRPKAWRDTTRVMLSKDFLLYRLTGVVATDPATALASLLFDARERCWSPFLCDLVGLDPADLPAVLPPTAVVGALLPEAASALGLPPGIPVVNGSLDSACETLAAGLTTPGDALIRLATAGGIHLVTPALTPHPRLITYYHPVAPLAFSQAGTSSCASAVKWALANFAPARDTSFPEWDTLALDVPPGADGLIFHPYLQGERCPHWDPHLKASFVGLTLHHGAPHFARAVYEGTAFSIRDAFSVIRELPQEPGDFTVVGGGAASDVWLQIVADVLAQPLNVPKGADSSLGAALFALVAIGAFPDLTAASRAAATDPRRIRPIPQNIPLYDRLFAAYADLHRRLAPVYAPSS